MDVDGTNPRRVYQDDLTVMGLEWSRDGRWLTFGAGAFFLGRSRGPARDHDHEGGRIRGACGHLGAGQCRVPELVARGDGDRVPLLDRERARRGTAHRRRGHRQVPRPDHGIRHPAVLVAPGRRDHVHRYAPDDRFRYDEFDIYTIRPDGTDLRRLTDAEGNDAHSLWSPDGNYILFSSSRFGYKDESPLVLNQPQPYAELFIMNADGSNQRPLTDNQYEEGTPAWLPAHLLKQE